jgi:hypothetical protein
MKNCILIPLTKLKATLVHAEFAPLLAAEPPMSYMA